MSINHSLPHAAVQHTPHATDAGLDIWGLFARHVKLLVAAVLIAAGVSYVYFEQMAPVYESMGRMVEIGRAHV